jgi:hypothetical protein
MGTASLMVMLLSDISHGSNGSAASLLLLDLDGNTCVNITFSMTALPHNYKQPKLNEQAQIRQ